jgi:hypothetical protein
MSVALEIWTGTCPAYQGGVCDCSLNEPTPRDTLAKGLGAERRPLEPFLLPNL